MTDFDEDVTLSRRPEPDRETLVLAHNITLQEEDPVDKWHRQQWEVTIQAVRVALDAWRKLWPLEADEMPDELYDQIRDVEHTLADLYASLDELSQVMLGDLLYRAQRGLLSDEEVRTLRRELELDAQQA